MTTIPKSGKSAWARQWLIFSVVVLMSMTGVNAAFAQSVSSGTIEGTVKDESNGVLPGVTITVTSPQLQVGQLVQVSDTAGSYKFVDVPAGTYRLKAELPGFSTSVRDDLRLTVGFNARVDLTLKLGAMEESVTVSGQSPVVDVTSTTASVAFTKEVLDSIPRGRDLQNVFAMAPGVTQAVADVGGSTTEPVRPSVTCTCWPGHGLRIAIGCDARASIAAVTSEPFSTWTSTRVPSCTYTVPDTFQPAGHAGANRSRPSYWVANASSSAVVTTPGCSIYGSLPMPPCHAPMPDG